MSQSLSPWSSPAVRVLAVLSAAFLVLAFTLAIMQPPTATLAHLFARWHAGAVVGIEAFVLANLSEFVWRNLVVPVLGRPCWLVPLNLALMLGGAAASLVLHHTRRSPQRRRG